jgi:hypothetical protein
LWKRGKKTKDARAENLKKDLTKAFDSSFKLGFEPFIIFFKKLIYFLFFD